MYPEGLTFNAIKDKKTEFIDFVTNGDAEDEKVEFIEDCFDDMDRPKFGYRVMVRLRDNEPCDINFENSDEDTCTSQLESDSKGRNGTDTKYLSQFAQNRQTGEGFRSAAPPDCRTLYVCGGQASTPAPTPADYNDDDYYDEIRLT